MWLFFFQPRTHGSFPPSVRLEPPARGCFVFVRPRPTRVLSTAFRALRAGRAFLLLLLWPPRVRIRAAPPGAGCRAPPWRPRRDPPAASTARRRTRRTTRRSATRRFRASDLGAAFPPRVPGSPCEPGSAWSPSSGACVAVGGDIGAGAFGGFRVDDSALADPRLPTLVTLLLALAIAASLFLLVAFGVLALARLAANKLAKRRRFVSDALELVARALTGAVDVLARANDDPRDANDPGRGATDDDAPAESSPRAPRDPNRDDDPPLDDDPDPDPEPPAGSRLGAAMGAAIARLALRPEPVGPAERAARAPSWRTRSRPGRRRRVRRRLPRRRREGLRPGDD